MPSPELINPIEPSATESLTMDQVMPRIMEIRQRIALMGANDSEFYDVDKIIGKMKKGDIQPEVALEEVTRLLNGKQDYH